MTIADLIHYVSHHDRFSSRACAPALKWLATLDPGASAKEAWQGCAHGDWMMWLCRHARIAVPSVLVRRWVMRAAREHVPTHFDIAIAVGCDAGLADHAAALRALSDDAPWADIGAAAATAATVRVEAAARPARATTAAARAAADAAEEAAEAAEVVVAAAEAAWAAARTEAWAATRATAAETPWAAETAAETAWMAWTAWTAAAWTVARATEWAASDPDAERARQADELRTVVSWTEVEAAIARQEVTG